MTQRKHRSVTQWKQILEKWQSSGLTVSQFCRDHKIPTSAFYRWKIKLGTEKACDRPSFIQVAIPETKRSMLELTFPAGHVLRFTESTPNQTLVSVLDALKEVGL